MNNVHCRKLSLSITFLMNTRLDPCSVDSKRFVGFRWKFPALFQYWWTTAVCIHIFMTWYERWRNHDTRSVVYSDSPVIMVRNHNWGLRHFDFEREWDLRRRGVADTLKNNIPNNCSSRSFKVIIHSQHSIILFRRSFWRNDLGRFEIQSKLSAFVCSF